MGMNQAGIVVEKGSNANPATPPPPAPVTPPPAAPTAEEIDVEEIDEKGGEGKHVPVSALIKIRQERNRFRDEIAELKKSGVPADTLKSALRDTILEMSKEEGEARRQAAAAAEATEGEDYDWNDPKLQPLARRLKKIESENQELRGRLDKGELAEETGKVRKEVDEAIAKFPKARRREVLSEAYLHPEMSIAEIAEKNQKEMESYEAGIINKYAAEKGMIDKGGGGPSGGLPPVRTADRIDLEDNPKGFIARLKEKLKIED